MFDDFKYALYQLDADHYGFMMQGQLPKGFQISFMVNNRPCNGEVYIQELSREADSIFALYAFHLRPQSLQLFFNGSIVRQWDEKEVLQMMKEKPWIVHVDAPAESRTKIHIHGSAFYAGECPVELTVLDEEGSKIEASVVQSASQDMEAMEPLWKPFFEILLDKSEREKIWLHFTHNGQTIEKVTVDIPAVKKESRQSPALKAVHTVKNKGIKALYYKGRNHISQKKQQQNYHSWFVNSQPNAFVLQKQKETRFAFEPKISLIVAAYNTPISYFDEMVESVLAQSYENWELCIADGSDNDLLYHHVMTTYWNHPRIRYKKLSQNYGISKNMNQAMMMASGQYIGLFDHDDLLTPDCLFEMVCKLQEFPYELVYSDEDKLEDCTRTYMQPHFKPDFSWELLRSQNYITHFTMFSSKLLPYLQGFHCEYDGAQDYDFILRAAEVAAGIGHVDKVLYHWRMHSASTAMDIQSKEYCRQASLNALEAHFQRVKTPVYIESLPAPYHGMYTYKHPLDKRARISIITTDVDGTENLSLLIDSLKKQTWQNWELLIVDGGSRDVETFEAYHKWKKTGNIVVLEQSKDWEVAPSFNLGSFQATGDLLLFINPTASFQSPEALERMAGLAWQSHVGAVSGKLLENSSLIDQYGLVVGEHGKLVKCFRHLDKDLPGYMGRALVCWNPSAVGLDCLMIRSDLFMQAGGFQEEFTGLQLGADLCFRLAKMGYVMAVDPESEVYIQNPKALQHKFLKKYSQVKFEKKWREKLKSKDGCYNSNFDNGSQAFKLPG